LYLRLAVSNLWKNRQTYVSFFLSSVCTIFVFYTFSMLALNDGIRKMPGASSMQIMMVLGAIVVAIFALMFLFYANSFLIKRRKKELGLYAILGLEKKHIARILFHETTALLIVSLITGIGLGIAMSKLMFLLIQALMHIPTPIVFQVNQLPLLLTVGLFCGVFFCLLLYNRLQVHLSSPVNCSRGSRREKRSPRPAGFWH
jgi:putative ABC transport system permease protein